MPNSQVNRRNLVGNNIGVVNRTIPIVTNGLVLWLDDNNIRSYPLSGATWFDISGNAINQTLVNSPTFSSNVNTGGRITYNGTNNYTTSTPNSLLNFCNSTNDLPFSSCGWYYINSSANYFSLYNKGDNGNGAQESYWAFVASSTLYVVLYDTIGANQTLCFTTTNVPTNQWVHLSCTYSGTGGNSGIKLYINGVLQPTNISGGGTYTRMRVQSTGLFVGSFGSVGVYAAIKSNGSYASLQIYNRELSAAEVLQNYSADAMRFGQANSNVKEIQRKMPIVIDSSLVLWLDANNIRSYIGSGTSWNDISGNGNNATLTNGPTFNGSVNNGGSIVFDGVNDYSITNSTFAIATNNRTYEVWIKINNLGSTGFFYPILQQNTAFNDALSININGLQRRPNNNFIINPVGNGTIIQGNTSGFDSTPYQGQWIHLVGVIIGSVSSSIYLNGNLVSTEAITINPQQTARYVMTGFQPVFNMNMAVARVYNRALSAAEILQNYSADAMRFGQVNSM
jgi:hypothetical protein